MPPSACPAVIDQYRRGRLSPMMASRLPRWNPGAPGRQASARTSSATCAQVHVCQIPRSFSRVAGCSPRTCACSSNKRGNVASSASMSSSPTRRKAIDQTSRCAAMVCLLPDRDNDSRSWRKAASYSTLRLRMPRNAKRQSASRLRSGGWLVVALLGLDDGGFGYLRRLVDFYAHKIPELGRGHRHRLGTEVGESLLDF